MTRVGTDESPSAAQLRSLATLEKLAAIEGLQDVARYTGAVSLGSGTVLFARIRPASEETLRGSMEFSLRTSSVWRYTRRDVRSLSMEVATNDFKGGRYATESPSGNRMVRFWKRDAHAIGCAISYNAVDLNEPDTAGELAVVRFAPTGKEEALRSAASVLLDGLGDVNPSQLPSALNAMELPLPLRQAA